MEDILLVRIVNHTGESYIVSSRRCPIIFLRIGLKVHSDREDSLVEICILLILVLLGPCGRGEKVGDKLKNRSSVTIFWSVPYPVPIV